MWAPWQLLLLVVWQCGLGVAAIGQALQGS